MGKPLVIVESPAKARTIGKFLGSDYLVEASRGHVRDLPQSAADIPKENKGASWARLGVNVDDAFQPLYIVPDDKKEQVDKLKQLMKGASMVFLATDEDREGESISWHLREVLKPKVPVKRLVFHEITEAAIRNALAHPRSIDENLVRAQETRRIVDRLYGYEVSPLLWKKVRPKLSAGRVQSVAVRLLVDRERERMAFTSSVWWDLEGTFRAAAGGISANLVEVAGKRLCTGKDFDPKTGRTTKAGLLLLDEAAAKALVARLEKRPGTVSKVEARPYKDRPAPPFTTSTLQQESVRKLRWSARDTMRVAQRLYENGWITYMRTDSMALSDQAIQAARTLIRSQYGPEYLPKEPRLYKTQVKNAQEAHEAIRPAGDTFRPIEDARAELTAEEARLYELIWKRTVACQMADSTGKLTSIAVTVDNAVFSTSGKTIEFPGFRRAYVEGSDDPEADLAEQERILPPLSVGDTVQTERLTGKKHTTQPPARLTEAALVKELEARGIGRPSTYASIIDTIIQRAYVFRRGSALIPTFTGFAVTALMERHLADLVDYDFTAKFEDELDQVSMGKRGSLECLHAFYLGEQGLRARLGNADSRIDPREVCAVPIGRGPEPDLIVRVGRYGPYIPFGEISVDVPDDTAPDEVTLEWAQARLAIKAAGPQLLGSLPDGTPIHLMNGRFGPYIQAGERDGKPRRASLLPGMTPETMTEALAIALLSLPRSLGEHDGVEVIATTGRFGPYVKRANESRSLPAGQSPLDVTLAEAVVLFATPARRNARTVAPLRELGAGPDGVAVRVMSGRFGPYVTDGTTNATLPKSGSPETIDLAAALELLARRREAGPSKPGRGARKAAPAKAAAPKAASSKAATSKSASAKAGSSKAASSKPASSKAEAADAGASSVKKPAAKAGASKASSSKTSTSKTSSSKASSSKSGTSKSGATRTITVTQIPKPTAGLLADSQAPAAAKPPAKAASTKKPAAKAASTKAASTKAASTKAGASKKVDDGAAKKKTPKA